MRRDYWLSITAFVAVVLILWLRAPDRIEHGFLWAEDAQVFLLDAHQTGFRSLFHPYAGYLHLLPRLIAWISVHIVSLAQTPYFFAWTCLTITALSSAYIAFAVRHLHPIAAIFLSIAPVISPQNGETLITITNLQWILFPCLLALLWECLFERPDRGYAWRAALFLLLGLTGPLGILAWPAAAVCVAVTWRLKRLLIGQVVALTVYTLAVFIQIAVILTHPEPRADVQTIHWIKRGVTELFGDLLPGLPSPAAGWVLALSLFVCISASRAILPCCLMFVFGVCIWALGVARVGNVDHFIWYGNGSRYLYLPFVLFLWLAIVALFSSRVRWTAALAGFVIAIILHASFNHFQVDSWAKWSIQNSGTGSTITVPPGWVVPIRS
jgi:hypothetical protein